MAYTKEDLFFRLQVNERVGNSLDQVNERVWKSVISVDSKAQKGYEMHFMAVKNSRKRSGFYYPFNIKKKVHL